MKNTIDLNLKEEKASFWTFIPFREKIIFSVIFLLILLSIYLAFFNEYSSVKFDPASTLIGLLPIIPVIAIWLASLKARWIDDLPTYLTVNLKDDNGYIAKFECIHSLTDSDLRGHAQSLLSSLVNGGRVSNLELFIRSENYHKGSTFIDENKSINQGEPFELKEITFQLTKNIERNATNDKQLNAITLKEGFIWYWLPEGKDKNKPYIKEPTQILQTKLENN